MSIPMNEKKIEQEASQPCNALLDVPKPCPFCGKEPDIQPKNPERQGGCWGRVRCKNKECPTRDRLFINDDIDVNDERGSHHYINRAIQIWNTRYA